MNNIFNKIIRIEFSENAATIVGTPKPIYFVLPLKKSLLLQLPPTTGLNGGYLILVLNCLPKNEMI